MGSLPPFPRFFPRPALCLGNSYLAGCSGLRIGGAENRKENREENRRQHGFPAIFKAAVEFRQKKGLCERIQVEDQDYHIVGCSGVYKLRRKK